MSGTAGAVTVPAELPTIAAPTLIIWGENDPVTPLSDGRAIDEAVPDATIEVLPATGHKPHREDPAAVGALLTEFLGR
jgi:pimeloyl-ACP methyl ester carboxylesterase